MIMENLNTIGERKESSMYQTKLSDSIRTHQNAFLKKH